MSFCKPSKFNKNYSAKKSIGFLSNNSVGWDSNLEKMDKIFVMNSASKKNLKKHGVNSELINPYYNDFNYKKTKFYY